MIKQNNDRNLREDSAARGGDLHLWTLSQNLARAEPDRRERGAAPAEPLQLLHRLRSGPLRPDRAARSTGWEIDASFGSVLEEKT